MLLFLLECGQLGKEICGGLRLIELLAMLIVVQEKNGTLTNVLHGYALLVLYVLFCICL